jgi:hypothetical protein
MKNKMVTQFVINNYLLIYKLHWTLNPYNSNENLLCSISS